MFRGGGYPGVRVWVLPADTFKGPLRDPRLYRPFKGTLAYSQVVLCPFISHFMLKKLVLSDYRILEVPSLNLQCKYEEGSKGSSSRPQEGHEGDEGQEGISRST